MHYKRTLYASFMAYAQSALIITFIPLLFARLHAEFNISYAALGFISSLNFAVQALVDFFGAKYVERIGYRNCILLALFFAALGFIMLGTLPYVLDNTILALVLSILSFAIGGGLIEVIVSPMVAALPSEKPSATMSLLHSFFSWGTVLAILVSTLYFSLFTLSNWRYLSYLWAVLPIVNALLFIKAPILEFGASHEKQSLRHLFRDKIFVLLLLLMFSAGASEIAMSQWASVFAESGLGLSKAMGDLLGPCMFAVFMGASRVIYAKIRIPLIPCIYISAAVCLFAYLITVFANAPLISLFGCALCGLSVGILWPGTLSLSAFFYPGGGTAMFAILALCGDIGCTIAPGVVGAATAAAGGNFAKGLSIATLFPLLTIIFMRIFVKKQQKNKKI